MSLLSILEFPDPRLRTVAKPVKVIDNAIKGLVDNLLDTMYTSHGVGLAATQVNVHQRIIVIDTSADKNNPICLINPKIIEKTGTEKSNEGCLSVPGIFEPVQRAQAIKVIALNQQGKLFELETDGLLAVCIQHEMDHLQGKLFVDYLSLLKRQRIKKKMDKRHKKNQ